MGSYVPSTKEERQKMLQAIGLNSVEELYQDCLLYTSRCV